MELANVDVVLTRDHVVVDEEEARVKRQRDAEELKEKLDKIARSMPTVVTSNKFGSQAGAGSGEFHTYRKARKREVARQEALDEVERLEKEQKGFQEKLAANQQSAEAKTAKNRAKRLAQKEKQRAKKKAKTVTVAASADEVQEEEEEEERQP